MVKGEDSQLNGCGFESQCCILDGVSEASFYIGKRNKDSQMEHTKKIFKKKDLTSIISSRFCVSMALSLFVNNVES